MRVTHQVLISLAANCDHEKNLAEARQRLGQVLSSVQFTPAIWTAPIGRSKASLYLNQLATGYTALTADELNSRLKQMERDMHRSEADRRDGIVRIDLDLMLYDSERHHLADWGRSYIQQLLPLLPEDVVAVADNDND